MDENIFDAEEFFQFSRELEKHHAIFDKMWALGRPCFSTKLETAGVYFDKVGECIDFVINPDFWKTLSFEQKQFVISHECLHVILYHGFRTNKLPKEQKEIANLALDIIVNHSLISKFGFSRKVIDPDNKLCWVDSVFKKNPPPPGKYYEYYFNLLMKELQPQPSSGSGKGNPGSGSNQDGQGQPDKNGQPSPGDSGNVNKDMKPLDDHDGLESFNNKEFDEKMKEIASAEDADTLKDFVENHTQDLKKQIKAEAGVEAGNIWVLAKVGKVKPKKKWETVIKKWASKFTKDNDIEQWAHLSRRLVFMPPDFMIPSDRELDSFEKDRIQVWFFQDTSGSCSGFIDRFFGAAMSLPVERFDVKMHCFDTRVYETTLESKELHGFGGTSFACIEKYIQSYMKKHNRKYPKAVFVITDGYGDKVTPEKAEVWHWFIDGSKSLVPDKSNSYNLKDFE